MDPAPKKILVVDDDPGVLFVACKRIRAAGWLPIPASDGGEAVRLMREHPDCRRVLTDFCMPFGGEGWIRYLEEHCSDYNVVVMSSDDIDPGVFIGMPKPLDFENVLHAFSREHERDNVS